MTTITPPPEKLSDETKKPAVPEPPRPTILVVDDSTIDRHVAGRVIGKRNSWRVIYANNGMEALDLIAQNKADAVVTDLQMPIMDGLTLVTRIRADYPRIPVIVMTGQGSEKIAVAALKAGAASYVTKRALAADLAAALEQVLTASQTDERQTKALMALQTRSSHFQIDNDPLVVRPLIGMLQADLIALGICDATAVTRVGIALEEVLLNAIYHGNLGISSDLKAVNEHAFHAQAAERRKMDPYQRREVQVTATLTRDRATFTITDEGDGFDVTQIPDPTDPAFFDRPSGRGILLIRAFMDEVAYNAVGNGVELVKHRDDPTAPNTDDDK